MGPFGEVCYSSCKTVKVIGHPLRNLGIWAFFSRLGSGSSTVHLYNHDGKRKLIIIGNPREIKIEKNDNLL